jgi:hypothetical protein
MTGPSNQPPDPQASTTEAPDTILIIIEGPGDKTRRPRRPNIPLDYPPPRPPASDRSEENGPPTA